MTTIKAGVATDPDDLGLGDAPVVAFQVDAVADKLTGATQVFDRPSGALRIDTCSLQLLSVVRDVEVVQEAREVATAIVESDPGLVDHPALATMVESLRARDAAYYLEKT